MTQAQHCLSEALRLAEHGYALTPVTLTRLPSGKKKATFHTGWRHESAWSNDPDQIKAWWTDHPDTSFAIGGAANGIEGVDLDVKEHADGVTWWSSQGLPLAPLVQHTPSGGVHLIWRVGEDDEGNPRSLPQSVDGMRGVDTRNRSGLFYAAGAYIVGEEGFYSIAGPLPHLEALDTTPAEVVALFAGREKADRPADGRIVVHDLDWQRAKCREAREAIETFDRDVDTEYRKRLQHLGLFYGRIVEQGAALGEYALTAEQAEAKWRKAHIRVWGPDVWPENVKDFRDALRDGPRLERWRTPERAAAEAEKAAETSGETDEDYEQALAYEVRKERLRREAKQRLAAEEREPLQVLDFASFLASPMPDYLVPNMLYRDGLAVVFGAPGAAKSFLVLDIALSLASGTPWRGQDIGTGVVHYVMAEGQSTNVLRTMAWLQHRGVNASDVGERFHAIPVPIMLTDAGVIDYIERVRADQPDMIILDTKNLMYAGKESQGDEYGAMLRVLHRLRVAAGGAAVVLVDHSGLGDDTRTRGSNAQKGGVETEIRVSTMEGIRKAEITRDKSGMIGTEWLYRLEQVPEVPRPHDVSAPAVCVPLSPGEAIPDSGMWERRRDDWCAFDQQPPLPDDVMDYSGKGATAVPALARFLRWNAVGGLGFSLASARKAVLAKMLNEKGKPKFSADTVDRAWGALHDMGRLRSVQTSGEPTGRSLWKIHPGDPEMPE